MVNMCSIGKKLFSPIFAINRRNPRIYYIWKYRCYSTNVKKIDENDENDDFFGFIRGDGVTDVVGASKKTNSLFTKYERIVRKPKSEKYFVTNFGSIRYDVDNQPEYHGQFTPVDADTEETEKEDQKHEENVVKNFTDKNMEEKIKEDKENVVKNNHEKPVSRFVDVANDDGIQQQNYFDEICFGDFSEKDHLTLVIKEEKKTVVKVENENYVDQVYFTNLIKSESNVNAAQEAFLENSRIPVSEKVVTEKPMKLKKEINKKSEIYFGNVNTAVDERKRCDASAAKLDSAENNFIDEVYFGKVESSEKEVESEEGNSETDLFSRKVKQIQVQENENVFSSSVNVKKPILRQNEDDEKFDVNLFAEKKLRKELKVDSTFETKSDKIQRKQQKIRTNEEVFLEKSEENRKKSKTDFKFSAGNSTPIPNVKKPQTAFDLVSKINQEKENKAIEEGRVVPQVIDLEAQPEHVVLDMLKQSVIYNQNDIVALNKPYGLTSQDGKKNHHCIQRYLTELARFVDKDLSTLHVVHRLDKGTTGVFLLARTEEMSQILKSWFRARTLQKTYWAIIKGVPDPPEGIINIPIAEGKIGDRRRMVLKPDYNEISKLVIKKSSVASQEAITEYKVLCQNGNAALVELQSKTGITHQLRVHLGFGLGCPILGDHKYSCVDRLVPQRLPGDVLQKLKIRQSKVRDLPIHLHARSVVIPEVTEGRNIFIRAELPNHFRWAMQRLKINKK